MKFAVASIGWNRPEMQKFSLGYLSKCREASKIDTFIFIDGGGMTKKQAKKLADRYRGTFGGGPYLIYRDRNWGLSKNILEGMRSLFNAGYDVVCLLEDDVIPSKDFLEYHLYIHNKYDLIKLNVFATVGYVRRPLPTGNIGRQEEVLRFRQWYIPDGVAFPRNTWETIESFIGNRYYSNVHRELNRLRKKIKKVEPGFVNKQWVKGKYRHPLQAGYLNALRAFHGMRCIMPCVSRCQDIGFYGYHQRQKKSKGEILTKIDIWKKSMWYSHCWNKDHEWKRLILVGKKNREFVEIT